MFLDYIEITNFRPYYGTQKITSGVENEKNFTVILANNGSGKTSLVNALTWCLYGEELHDIRDKTEPLYNKKAAKEALEENPSDPSLDVSVRIKFHYFDNNNVKKYFEVSRSLSFSRWVGDKWTESMDDNLLVEESDKHLKEGDHAQEVIEAKIPRDMFQYFFFNGAALSNYFESSDSKKNNFALRRSIEKISQIELINKVQEHLSGMLKEYNKDYKKNNVGTTVNFNAKIEETIDKIQELKFKRKSNYKKIDEASANEQTAKNKLKNASSDRVKELNERRDELEEEKKSLNLKIKSNIKEYEDLILELFPLAALFDELVKSVEICDEGIDNKTVPSVEKDLLKDILKEGYCICGTKLEDHPECVEELKHRLETTSDIGTYDFYREYYAIKDCINKLKNIHMIDKLRLSIESDKETLNLKINELNSISEQLSSFNADDIVLYEREYQKNKLRKNELRKENEILNSRIDSLMDEKKKFENERKKSKKIEGKLNILDSKITFCEEAIEVTSQLEDKIQNYIREKITNKTKEQFIGIEWAYNKFTDVNIKQNYAIEVTKSTGEKVAPGDLSDGEENLLALSFMMALHSIAGFEIPLFIDAPLEKLDKNKRLEFIDGLYEFTKNKQLVFLFTDSQYTNEVRAHMLDHVIKEYELKPYENRTEIVKHG